MWMAYKYIYYRLYTWFRKKWGDEDAPEYSAAIGMSMNLGLNFGSLATIIYIISNVNIIPEGLSKAVVVLPFLIVVVLHYFAFIHHGKCREIEKEFKGESKKERKRKGFWVLLYAVGSPVLFILLGFFGIWLKH